jgi:nitroreductase/dihydropteridine reductase
MDIKQKYEKLKLKYIDLSNKHNKLKSDINIIQDDLQKLIEEESNTFLTNLKWRRAEKFFAPGSVNIEPIKTAIINAPSAYGMQPYHVLVIRDKKLKEKLKPVCMDQNQITDCYALFIFCVYTDLEARMNQYIEQNNSEDYRESIISFMNAQPNKIAWAAKQAYISLGYALAAATELKIASCPIEGFTPKDVAKILKLEKKLAPVVLFAVGRHVSFGPSDKKDIIKFKEKIKDYKLKPRFRFNDIIEDIN